MINIEKINIVCSGNSIKNAEIKNYYPKIFVNKAIFTNIDKTEKDFLFFQDVTVFYNYYNFLFDSNNFTFLLTNFSLIYLKAKNALNNIKFYNISTNKQDISTFIYSLYLCINEFKCKEINLYGVDLIKQKPSDNLDFLNKQQIQLNNIIKENEKIKIIRR